MAGVASGPLFYVLAILQMLIRPGFDIRIHAISLLTLGDLGWIQSVNFIATGVLVISAPVGSPANESGLMDGDVITRVAGQSVRSVAEVRNLVGMAKEKHAVELEILREKKAQKILLRW